MKERPILFSTPMVKAILDGTKTMTRRVVKKVIVNQNVCPYGSVREKLWVRETWTTTQYGKPVYRADGRDMDGNYWDITPGDKDHEVKWKPSIFMPRWASRILLEITDIRVERLQEITSDQIEREGINCDEPFILNGAERRYAFEQLWNSINSKKPDKCWDANPWVWVVEFRRLSDESC